MKQVDFYLISNRVNNAKFKLASRLCQKLQGQQKSSLVVTESAEDTAELDKVMWSFSDTSFVAHDNLKDPQPEALVHIGDHNSVSPMVLERGHDVLINLSSGIPMFNHHFSRIAEIIEADEQAKAAARIRYKNYQGEGFELKMHNIEL